MFNSQNTENPKILRSEHSNVNQVCKTNVIPKLTGSWIKMKLNFWKCTSYGWVDRIWVKWMKPTRLLGRKHNLNIIYPLIGVNGLGKMAHWIDYIGDQVF